jgi:hypothetical protein
MRSRFKTAHIVIAAVNAVAVAGALVLTAMGSSAARSQSYNYAAERWKGESKDTYAQLSCFFSDDAGFNKSAVKDLKGQIYGKLEEISVVPENGKTLILDACSTDVGEYELICDSVGKSEAELTAVSGDFFFFHDFQLLSGSFFDDEDIMHDGVVIDEQLAWNLYGGNDIIGMNIYINNVKLFVSGVIKVPETDPEQRCIGDMPKAYVSYDVAEMLKGDNSSEFEMELGMSTAAFDKVTCYECIAPDPIDNFAYSTIDKIVGETYKEKVSVVNNTKRFSPDVRLKAFKKIDDYAIRKDKVVYPFWENASRIVEVKLSMMYGIRRYFLAVPVLTLIWLAIKVFILYERKKAGMKKAFRKFISDKWESLSGRFSKKAVQEIEKKA